MVFIAGLYWLDEECIFVLFWIETKVAFRPDSLKGRSSQNSNVFVNLETQKKMYSTTLGEKHSATKVGSKIMVRLSD